MKFAARLLDSCLPVEYPTSPLDLVFPGSFLEALALFVGELYQQHAFLGVVCGSQLLSDL